MLQQTKFVCTEYKEYPDLHLLTCHLNYFISEDKHMPLGLLPQSG